MKEFLQYDQLRNNTLLLAHKMYFEDGFVPDVIYTSLRGGAYMANIISEYYKIGKDTKRVLEVKMLQQTEDKDG